jgi:hypothetical protein
MVNIALGSAIDTSTALSSVSWTTALHGSIRPLRFGEKSTVGEHRVAGAKDKVAAKLDADLLLQRISHVDASQHAKALTLQGRHYGFDRGVEAEREPFLEAVSDIVHGMLLLGGSAAMRHQLDCHRFC